MLLVIFYSVSYISVPYSMRLAVCFPLQRLLSARERESNSHVFSSMRWAIHCKALFVRGLPWKHAWPSVSHCSQTEIHCLQSCFACANFFSFLLLLPPLLLRYAVTASLLHIMYKYVVIRHYFQNTN